MDAEREIQSVLRCGLCNKPFNKQSTLKRHGYYCRSRRAGPIQRPRSCIACARRKARCDNRRPECSRCSAKGVECRYPSLTSRNRDSDVSPTTGSTSDSRSPRGANPALTIPDSGPYSGIVNLGFSSEIEPLNWDNYDTGLDLNFASFDFLDPILQSNEKPAGYQSTHSDPSAGEVQGQQSLYPQLTIPPLPSLPRLLVHRPESNTGGKRTTTLILHTLKSYFLMMLREDTLPPFIHPHSLAHPSLAPNYEVQNNYNTYNPLANCITLIQTLGTSLGKNRKSFWEHVRTECNRICSRDYQSKLNRWGLLGAMQALTVYILIRLDEGETDENNLDFLFLAAVTAIAQQLCSGDAVHDLTSGLYDDDDEGITWKEWIFEESRRRLSIIYRIINMLVYFEPAARCDLPTDLVLAPLPAKKPLWEANDEAVWQAETERNPRLHQTAFGIAASGSLVRLDKDGHDHGRGGDAVLSHTVLDVEIVSRSPADWEEWCSGMDGFGGLVMLAASLVV